MLARTLRENPEWGGLLVIGLLMIDLLLPVPGTVVISAVGFVYGPMAGGVIATVGLLFAAIAGYLVGRWIGVSRAAAWMGEDDLARARRWLDQGGVWMVCLSRGLPMLPEAISCTAGLVKMSFLRFVLAALCGCIPMGFGFAWIGWSGRENPLIAIVLTFVIPATLWTAATLFRRAGARKRSGESLH